MAELQRGQTFSDGMVVNAATLNNLVDLGIALEGLISDKTDTVPAAGDYVLFWKSGSLFKCKFSELPAQVSSVGLAMPTELAVTGSPVTGAGTLTAAWKNQPGNKFLSGPVGTTGTPSFRFLVATDLALASVTVPASTIDWSLGNLFQKQITSDTTFSFANVQDGQTIKVIIEQDSVGNHNVNMPHHIWWRGGAFPIPSFVAFVADIWEFTCYGTGIFGKADLNYRVID
jgi:hypothetical protein